MHLFGFYIVVFFDDVTAEDIRRAYTLLFVYFQFFTVVEQFIGMVSCVSICYM